MVMELASLAHRLAGRIKGISISRTTPRGISRFSDSSTNIPAENIRPSIAPREPVATRPRHTTPKQAV